MNKEIISKELLSEVYNFDVKDFVSLGTDDVTYEVRFDGLRNGYKYNIINIHELAHKCKEWAYRKNDAIIYSAICNGCHSAKLHFRGRSFGSLLSGEEKEFNYGLEYLSIFKACQWLYERKDK